MGLPLQSGLRKCLHQRHISRVVCCPRERAGWSRRRPTPRLCAPCPQRPQRTCKPWPLGPSHDLPGTCGNLSSRARQPLGMTYVCAVCSSAFGARSACARSSGAQPSCAAHVVSGVCAPASVHRLHPSPSPIETCASGGVCGALHSSSAQRAEVPARGGRLGPAA